MEDLQTLPVHVFFQNLRPKSSLHHNGILFADLEVSQEILTNLNLTAQVFDGEIETVLVEVDDLAGTVGCFEALSCFEPYLWMLWAMALVKDAAAVGCFKMHL